MSLHSVIAAIENKEERELNLFNAEFENVIAKVEKLLTIAIIKIDDPLEFDFEVQKILNEAGYYSLVDKLIDESYDKSYSEILEALSESGVVAAFTNDDLLELEKLKQLDLDMFQSLSNETAELLKRDLYKYNLSNLSQDEIIDNMVELFRGSKLARYSRTYAETAISNYHQTIFDMKIRGLEDELVYIYQGPSPDKITRDFCKCLMKKKQYYTRVDGNIIKNSPKRRYNCRHRVVGITEDRAIALGYEKGDFSC